MSARLAVIVTLACAAWCGTFAAIGEAAAHAAAVPVALSDAAAPPTEAAYLRPGARVTYAYPDGSNCAGPRGGYFSDVSAYRWNGRALGAQRWNADHTLTYWRARHGRVTFDGVTFRNHTGAPVIVAGWCDTAD